MAVAIAQADWDGSAASSATQVYASGLTMTSGNLIAVIVGYTTGGQTISGVTDSLGNTYTPVDTTASGGTSSKGFYAKNITGGAGYTITVTYSAAVTNRHLGFIEISGADTTAPLVANIVAAQATPGTGTDAITSGAATPSASNSRIFGFGVSPGRNTVTVTAGTGFAIAGDSWGGYVVAESLLQGAAASQAATFTQSAGGLDWMTHLMAFKPPGGGAFSLACDTSSYAVTGSDTTLLAQAIQTWLRVGR